MTLYLNARNGMTNHDEVDVQTPFNTLVQHSNSIVNANDLAVVPNSGMSIQVGTGSALVYISALSSLFYVNSDATTNITISSNATGSTRIDLICLKFDTGITPNADASNVCSIVTVEGTAGAGVPSTPTSHYVLAQVTVASGASSIGSGQITDKREKIKLNPNVDIYSVYIKDANGNEVFETGYNASAVNHVKVTNAATGNAPTVSATGDDTNIDLKLIGKGTGKVQADASYGAITNGTDASTITINCATSNRHRVILGGNRTLALSNAKSGQNIILDLIQDSTGSRTVTWPTTTNTATMTIATPAVITSGLDLPTLTPVYFTTSGALPTGVTANTVYYWVRQSSTTGNLATSVTNAQAGTYVATSGSQSGTHTIYVKVRWPLQTEPTLSVGKYLVDTFGLYIVDSVNGVIQGYTGGQGL